MKAKYLGRYTEIGRLLLKHAHANVVGQDFLADSDVAATDADATAADAEELAADLEAMGPTFVKLGQLLSTRADVLPPVYLKALSRLQDQVTPVPFEDIERVVTTRGRRHRLAPCRYRAVGSPAAPTPRTTPQLTVTRRL
jgi:ubiquinone biosynthesis protein